MAVMLLIGSPSSRRAWIEIEIIYQATTEDDVALLAEGVDRNFDAQGNARPLVVALLAEGVDRNLLSWWFRLRHCGSPSSRRAWIEILAGIQSGICSLGSPSSRRAWIEMVRVSGKKSALAVALLAEGVDRNSCRTLKPSGRQVALLAEGVDRNFIS